MWKKPKTIYRLHINTPDGTIQEDLYPDEITPDAMLDLHAYFNWLFDTEDWEISQYEEKEIWSRGEMRCRHTWRAFYQLYGDGSCLTL